jgi:hypothetical protein
MTTNAFRSLHESPRGFNYRFVIDHTDLTTSADNTAQDITLITLPAYSVVKSAATYLEDPVPENWHGGLQQQRPHRRRRRQ